MFNDPNFCSISLFRLILHMAKRATIFNPLLCYETLFFEGYFKLHIKCFNLSFFYRKPSFEMRFIVYNFAKFYNVGLLDSWIVGLLDSKFSDLLSGNFSEFRFVFIGLNPVVLFVKLVHLYT